MTDSSVIAWFSMARSLDVIPIRNDFGNKLKRSIFFILYFFGKIGLGEMFGDVLDEMKTKILYIRETVFFESGYDWPKN